MDFRRLDLNLLLVLNGMFDERSVTAVASRLGVSQPTVSLSLGKLRDFFADELFVRTREGMLPTAFALTLRDPIREILSLMERHVFPAVRFDPATSRRTFTICTSDTGELCFLPAMAQGMEQVAPGISLRTVTLHPAELKEAFSAGTVDLAIGNFPDIDRSACSSEDLTTDNFVCIARRGHPIARSPLTLEMYMACDHAIVAARNRNLRLYEGTVQQLGLTPRVRLRPEHFLSLSFIIASSDIMATVPLAVATAFAAMTDLEMYTPPFEINPILIAQYWHPRRDTDPDVTWLRGFVHDLFAGKSLSDLQRKAAPPPAPARAARRLEAAAAEGGAPVAV